MLCQVARAAGQIFIFALELEAEQQDEEKKERRRKMTMKLFFLRLPSAYYQIQRSSGKGDKDKSYYVFAEFLFFKQGNE